MLAALRKALFGDGPRVRLEAKQPAAPEVVHGEPHPMTGFFAGLTEEQKGRALAYRGPDWHGGAEGRGAG